MKIVKVYLVRFGHNFIFDFKKNAFSENNMKMKVVFWVCKFRRDKIYHRGQIISKISGKKNFKRKIYN